jgi:pimeloyl-ACP methyl ester carboxylesterase
VAIAASPAALPAPQIDTGTLQGAPYRIDIPANWNGDLVVLMHGYETKGEPRKDPWPQDEAAPVFLSRGYAVAASAFASQGWAIEEALTDSEQLRRQFIRMHGQPHRMYAVGFSLGGFDALATLERHRRAYDGALSLCGANVPTPELIARGVVEPLAAFEVFFPGILPDLADPASPPMIDPRRIQQALQSDPVKATRLAKRLQETDASLPDALVLYYIVLRELEQRAGGMPVDTTPMVYRGYGDDAVFNRKVRRYQGAPSAIAYLRRDVTLTGRIDAPVVLQWNAFDPTVPERFDTIYPQLVASAGDASHLTVLPPVGQGHCAFTPDQIGQAFDTLVEKVDGGQGDAH